jgi:hypothetical protein
MRDRGTDRERELFDYAFRLEGLMRHASRHAAGSSSPTGRSRSTCRSSSTRKARS